MNSLLAEDYTGITPDGTLQTKEDTLANLRSGRVRFSAIDVHDVLADQAGDFLQHGRDRGVPHGERRSLALLAHG